MSVRALCVPHRLSVPKKLCLYDTLRALRLAFSSLIRLIRFNDTLDTLDRLRVIRLLRMIRYS